MKRKQFNIFYGRQLAAHRRKRQLSLRDIQELTGVHPTTLSHLEHGKIAPTFQTAVKLAECFGEPLDAFKR